MSENSEQRHMDHPQGQVGPGLTDSDEFFTRTLELTEWFNSGLSTSGSFDVGIMVASPFGKLLDALPIPAMMIDASYKVVFANQACGTISDNYKIIQGVPFPTLVPRPRNSEKALAVVKRVFLTRRPIIAEAILEIDARKVWGRLYFRSVRIGSERYVLLVIEDLTSEKTRLLLKQKTEEQKNILISAANEKLSEQVRRREQIERALKLERDKFEKLVELLKLSMAVMGTDGRFRYISPDFKQLFGEIIDELSPRRRVPNVPNPETDSYSAEIREWFGQLSRSEEASDSVRTFTLKHRDGSEKMVECRAVKLDNSECLVVCEDLSRNGHPRGT